MNYTQAIMETEPVLLEASSHIHKSAMKVMCFIPRAILF